MRATWEGLVESKVIPVAELEPSPGALWAREGSLVEQVWEGRPQQVEELAREAQSPAAAPYPRAVWVVLGDELGREAT
jgi:hypothetical protein